ncbi:MAG: hypothetical protein NTW86_15100 [Candidatus Sumerlaeota bacterium]|nr:hypothetical protein [Candidatus Sumerlaeota bacterium]
MPTESRIQIVRSASPLGIAALVLGIIACLFCWIPFLGLLAIPLAVIGMLLASIGFVLALINRKTGFAFPIAGGVVCLVSALIAVGSTGKTATAVTAAMERDRRTNQEVVTPATSPDGATAISPNGKAHDDAVTEQEQKTHPQAVSPIASSNADTTGMPSSGVQTEEVAEWARVPSAVRQGEIQVRVKSARLGKIPLKDLFGESTRSTEDLLSVALEVTNSSKTKKINFLSWRGQDFAFGRDFAVLTDDSNNVYKRITFGATTQIVGSADRQSVYPGKSIADILVFEKPIDNLKWLHLEIPAGNVGGEGMFRFEIPGNMIGGVVTNPTATSSQTPAPVRQGRQETKVGAVINEVTFRTDAGETFGILGVRGIPAFRVAAVKTFETLTVGKAVMVEFDPSARESTPPKVYLYVPGAPEAQGNSQYLLNAYMVSLGLLEWDDSTALSQSDFIAQAERWAKEHKQGAWATVSIDGPTSTTLTPLTGELAKVPLAVVVDIVNEIALKLDSGETVELLGVRGVRSLRGEAMEKLRQYLVGRPVYVREDTIAPRGPLRSVYVFARDEAHPDAAILINARMAEVGLLRYDDSTQFALKDQIRQAEDFARLGRRGIWQSP